MLKELGTNGCSEVLHTLTERGLCQLEGGQYPLLVISQQGWEVMQGRIDAPPMCLTLSKSRVRNGSGERRRSIQAEPMDKQSEAWAQRIRNFRSAEAQRRSVAPFMVFSNRTLSEIAQHRPTTQRDFLQIHGLGSARWDTFGERLIAMMKEEPVQEED